MQRKIQASPLKIHQGECQVVTWLLLVFCGEEIKMKKILLGLPVGSFPGIAFADCINMMDGESGMMMSWGNHMGGRLFMGLFGLLYLVGVVLFFCLLFRITRALETIAKAKKVE
jgi:hypothetical protein